MAATLYRRFRRLLAPLHPHRLRDRLMRVAVRLGYNYVRLWVLALSPRRILATIRWGRWLRDTIRRRRTERRLTVAVDVSAFWEPLTGVGWYLYRLLQHLADREDVRLRLYGPGLVDKRDVPPPVVELPAGPALEEVRYRVPENLSFVHYYLADKLRRVQDRLIAADGNAVLFAPNYFLPPWFDRCRGALVATVHDLSFRKVPATLRDSTRRDLETHFQSTVERAERILTDSRTVRAELLESGLVDGSRVDAVILGPGSVSAETRGESPENAPQRYALHVGTLEPRKSLPTLLAAWRLLRARGAPEERDAVAPEERDAVAPEAVPSLVLCGGLGWKSDQLRVEIDQAQAEGWLVHYGYLPDQQVAALYRGALLVAMPSIYEGFGLPAVEAMGFGVPLVLSDIPVLREMAGEAAIYVPPELPEAWADALARILGDEQLRADLARRGRERSQLFDWRTTAEQTVAVWQAAAKDVGSQKRSRLREEVGVRPQRTDSDTEGLGRRSAPQAGASRLGAEKPRRRRRVLGRGR